MAFAGSAAGAPFSLVEALHRSGLSKDAVDLLHRSAAGTPGSDAEACTVLDIHLACRSPSQAFLQVLLLGLGPGLRAEVVLACTLMLHRLATGENLASACCVAIGDTLSDAVQGVLIGLTPANLAWHYGSQWTRGTGTSAFTCSGCRSVKVEPACGACADRPFTSRSGLTCERRGASLIILHVGPAPAAEMKHAV